MPNSKSRFARLLSSSKAAGAPSQAQTSGQAHLTSNLFAPGDVKYLNDRSIDLQLAWNEGVRPKSESDVRSLLKNPTIVGGALVASYQDHPSRPSGYYRAQLHNPKANQGRKTMASKGSVPPYIPSTLGANSREPIMVVESPFKALALASNGWPRTFSLGGVSAGAFIKGTDKLQDEVVQLLHCKPPIVLLFDSDRETNPAVASAEARLARAFMNFGCDVLLVILP